MAESLSFPWAEMEAGKGLGLGAQQGWTWGGGRWRPGIVAEETARGSCLRTCAKTSEQSEPTDETSYQESIEELIGLVL